MATEKEILHAKTAYALLCKELDNNNWKYSKHEENLAVNCTAQGDEFPINLSIGIESDGQAIIVLADTVFKIEEDKKLDAIIGISAINNLLICGSFDYDFFSGAIRFRLTTSILDTVPKEGLFMHMITFACLMMDEYCVKLFGLSKGLMQLDQFLDSISN